MPQGIFPFKYEEEKSVSGTTSLAGLPVYLDLASVLNMGESIATHLHVKTQGWTDEQIVLSLILLNLAGGECVDDLRILEADQGFCRILHRVELKGHPLFDKKGYVTGEWAEVCFVPNKSATTKKGDDIHRWRYY